MYEKLYDFFENIKHCNYVVLRNYETFENNSFLTDHPDIDILCEDLDEIIRRAPLHPIGHEDKLHYEVNIKEKNVHLDIRTIGDGYYCEKWEKMMLLNKRNHINFNVLSREDYFYSLIYHVLVHKYSVSNEYKKKISEIGGIDKKWNDIIELKNTLENYMRAKEYLYSLPSYTGTICNIDNVNMSISEFTRKDFILRKVKRLVGIDY